MMPKAKLYIYWKFSTRPASKNKLNITQVLNKSPKELNDSLTTADAETQATSRYLISKIQEKDHNGLINFLRTNNVLGNDKR